MLTIVLECRDSEAELAQTLSALVAGAVEGLVRDVVVLDRGSRDGTAKVADAAGCRFLEAWDMKDVVGAARGEWLLLLEPGARPLGGWVEVLAEHLATSRAPARFAIPRGHRLPFLRRFGRRPAPLERGFLLTKREAAAMARPGMGLEQFARGGAVRTLSAEIVPARVIRAMRVEA